MNCWLGSCLLHFEKVKVLVERWRQTYNRIRPQSALGYRPPAPETIRTAKALTHLAAGTTTGAGHLRITLWLKGNYRPRGIVRSLLLTAC